MSGSGIIEAEVFRSEQVSRLARTSDPSSPERGDAWIRTDVQPTTDSVAALRVQGDSGVLEAPLFDPSVSLGEDVYVGKRFLFSDGTEGHLLVTDQGGAVGSPRIVTSTGTEYEAHDATEVNVIPDGLLKRYDPRELDGISDGDTVGSCPDLIGDDALTGSATYRPSGFNGNPALEYNPSDTDSHIGTFASSISPPYDIWVVANINPTGSDEALVEADSPGARVYDPDFNSVGEWYMATGDGNLENVSYAGGSNDILHFEFEDGDSAFRVNDSDLARGDAGIPSDLDGLTFAERKDQSDHAEVTRGEILVGDPSDPDYSRSTVYQYLVDGWQ
jgi:hypothetical protein